MVIFLVFFHGLFAWSICVKLFESSLLDLKYIFQWQFSILYSATEHIILFGKEYKLDIVEGKNLYSGTYLARFFKTNNLRVLEGQSLEHFWGNYSPSILRPKDLLGILILYHCHLP